MRKRYNAVYDRRGRWVVAYVEEIPGVNTQGRTLQEARENLKDALRLVVEVNRELARKRERSHVRREPMYIEVPA